MSALGTSIGFAPLIPWEFLYAFAGVGLLIFAAAMFLRARGSIIRAAAMALLWLVLANPSLVVENRQPIRDIAVVVVDESPSQAIDGRIKRNADALKHVRESVQRMGNLDLRVIRIGLDKTVDGTLMFGTLERAMTDIPRKRLAGIIIISDGQIHDAPTKSKMIRNIGPIHLLLTGKKNEGDRRLVIEKSPSYGLLGKPITLRIRVDDNAAITGARARVTVQRDGKLIRTLTVPVNRSVPITVELEHRGTTFFEVSVGKGTKELTLENNRKVITVNGIRDRLRVLLISGEPHPGERAWRNLLKSDPGVDLVHFTILRPPEKRDMTPVNELALISFPVRQLFQEKLGQFHLIIFDRYRRRGVIRSRYLNNIADYVRKGGALMVAAGPSYAGPLSLAHTSIGPLLPGRQTGKVITQGFRPLRSVIGKRHPVTARLPGRGDGHQPWGRWFRQIDVVAQKGHVLMTGVDRKPLLIVNRVGKGRVAQLLSDQVWLWDRGFEGGGPQAEMLRRVSHWLMKEPELEEEYLAARIKAKRLEILRRSLKPSEKPAIVTMPDGKKVTTKMKDRGDGTALGTIPLKRPGLYRITDGKLTTMVAVGSLNAREMSNVRTTDKRVQPAITANGGSVVWLGETGLPEIRRVALDRRVAGSGGIGGRWIGLRQNGDYVVTGIRVVPLMVGFIALLLILLPLLLAWRREGR